MKRNEKFSNELMKSKSDDVVQTPTVPAGLPDTVALKIEIRGRALARNAEDKEVVR